MSSALTPRQWITVVLVNMIVSAVTTLIVVRVLMNQPSPHAASASSVAVATLTPQPDDSANAPVQAAPTNTPAPVKANPTPTRVATNTAAAKTPTRASASISSTVTANTGTGKVRIGRVLFPGQRQRESVVIANDTDTDVSLSGWVLSSSRNISYTFGNVTLLRNNFISLHTTTGTDVPTDLFWNRTDPAWQVGDVLTLSDEDQVITTYTVTNR